jgi:hypothetical protein
MRLDRLFVGLVFAFAIACGGGGGGGGGDGEGDGDGDGDMDAGPGDAGGDDGGDAGGDDGDGDDADAGPGCGLVTCQSSGAGCGQIGDGCGDVLECGACSGLETCGGGGEASECGGSSACIAATCESAGATCGQIGDGCGGVTASCGTCVGEAVCGGNGVPSVCSDEGPGACVGLCEQQTDCSPGLTTSVSGTVYTPSGTDVAAYTLPLYNVSVYVPNGVLEALTTGNEECLNCDAPITGDPLIMTTTGADGTFTLEDMPVGTDIPLVIQAGKWRRVVTIPAVTACVDTPLDASLTRFPRTQAEGHPMDNIPRIALTTGGADALECLLPKIGIAAAEFTQPVGTGRVNMFGGHGGTYRWAVGVNGGADFPFARSLWDSPTDMNDYDMVLLSCEGAGDWPLGEPTSGAPEPDDTAANRGFRDQTDLAALKDYLDLYGGRVFASHWHHSWVELAPAPMNAVATFGHRPNPPQTTFTVQINQAFPKGAALAEWLFHVAASTTLGELVLRQARHDVLTVDETLGFRWIDGINPNDGDSAAVQYMSFNTPTTADNDEKCGRMVVTDIHVSNTDDSDGGLRFPTSCTSTNLLPEEKALIFMLFDLASCVTTDVPVCDPQDCVDVGATCGQVADGCGELVNCGPCEEPDTCGGGGVPNQCGNDGCVQTSCEDEEAECGYIADGCGGALYCGDCTLPDTCGGTDIANVCGHRTVD